VEIPQCSIFFIHYFFNEDLIRKIKAFNGIQKEDTDEAFKLFSPWAGPIFLARQPYTK
jgi:hypothetical protein